MIRWQDVSNLFIIIYLYVFIFQKLRFNKLESVTEIFWTQENSVEIKKKKLENSCKFSARILETMHFSSANVYVLHEYFRGFRLISPK